MRQRLWAGLGMWSRDPEFPEDWEGWAPPGSRAQAYLCWGGAEKPTEDRVGGSRKGFGKVGTLWLYFQYFHQNSLELGEGDPFQEEGTCTKAQRRETAWGVQGTGMALHG